MAISEYFTQLKISKFITLHLFFFFFAIFCAQTHAFLLTHVPYQLSYSFGTITSHLCQSSNSATHQYVSILLLTPFQWSRHYRLFYFDYLAVLFSVGMLYFCWRFLSSCPVTLLNWSCSCCFSAFLGNTSETSYKNISLTFR